MPEWYIEELKIGGSEIGSEVEFVNVDMKAGAHKKPDYLKMHPFGQVPVLDDNGLT